MIEQVGIELTFAQNVASRFRLTKDLLPLLRPGSRVINCLGAGNGSVVNTQDWELKENFSFIKAAGQGAGMTDFLALEFGSRFGSDSQVGFFSFYPGVVNTKSVANQNFPWILQVGASLFLPLIGTAPETVADRILALATENEYAEGEFAERHAGLIGPNGKAITPLPKYISDYPEVGKLVYEYVDRVSSVPRPTAP
jgi:NAD(P)-dependent dehydrogenase (short-subunit alcohol dehydrogenase family)